MLGNATLAGEVDDDLTSDTVLGGEVDVVDFSLMPLHSQQEVEQEAAAWATVWHLSGSACRLSVSQPQYMRAPPSRVVRG